MMLTRAGDYALRSMVYLAEQPKGKVTILNEIAEKQGIPRNFLAKILQALVKSGLVRSHQGVNGGYSVGNTLEAINVEQIIETGEGPIHRDRGLIGEGECERDSFCTIHNVWVEAQEKLIRVLEEATLADLARKAHA
jgi:Rrf2 family protein